MKWLWQAAAALTVIAAPAAAAAPSRGFEAYDFTKAVAAQDNAKALELLGANPTLVNARGEKGRTPLLVAIEGEDSEWIGFLLNQGADANLAGEDGDRPLIAAARKGLKEPTAWLLLKGAKVDATNKRGETALILAVQSKQLEIVKFLLNKGADPDKRDSFAGYSARDYAKQDTRSREIIKAIEAKKPTAG